MSENRKAKNEKRQEGQMPEAGTKNPIRDFTDLEVWKVARELRKEIYKAAQTLPDFERFALASQLRRAATSVTANIAEGYGRYGYQENAQHCRQARGSVYELRDHLITCIDEEYLSPAEGSRLGRLAIQVIQLLNGYLRSTLARKEGTER